VTAPSRDEWAEAVRAAKQLAPEQRLELAETIRAATVLLATVPRADCDAALDQFYADRGLERDGAA
jgi:hypothetical protein